LGAGGRELHRWFSWGCRRRSCHTPVVGTIGLWSNASSHDVHAAVDVERLAGEAARVRRGEVGADEANVVDLDQLADRCAARGLVEEQVEVLQPRAGAGLDRSGGDRVHADALRTELE